MFLSSRRSEHGAWRDDSQLLIVEHWTNPSLFPPRVFGLGSPLRRS
ncbi:hypothetical protein EG68_00051 [Paragonimus skrjabini miyazakii]|uniref:Uncharacterized protein n=1 Tax=Paragonimus skrjabini miyazakii TaxID=59628 RepID=A0A8S9ZAY2_9TREM|nr:hypothetical protein EG68_00051 [Paragonimus skrjabini miyazakii]